MAKGDSYGPERAILTDPRSGLRIIRLTHYSTITMNLYFEMCSFTEDEQHVVVLTQRGAGRDAPWDLFRARTDGLELVQMTECDAMAGIVVAPGIGAALYHCGSELRKVDIATLEEAVVAEVPCVPYKNPLSLASVDARGTAYFSSGVNAKGNGIVFKADVRTGKCEVLFEGGYQNHIHVDPQGKTLYFGEHTPDGPIQYLVNTGRDKGLQPLVCPARRDGTNLRRYPFLRFAHLTWLGETGKMQGCLLPPGQAIVTYAEGDAEPVVVTQGRYYWHSSASRDAQWIVSDTNWPREGIYLVHVPTGTVTYVCDPLSSCSHPQWTHPHPALSPNMRFVLFNSDMTGLGQAYLAELTPEFREQAAQGHLCRPNALA